MHCTMLKSILFCLLLFLAARSNHASAQVHTDSISKAACLHNLLNSTWHGVDSDGDFYEFTFLEGGRLRYRTTTARTDTASFSDPEDKWLFNGSSIAILLGNTSVQLGTVHNDAMEGSAWNLNGRRWTWKLNRKKDD